VTKTTTRLILNDDHFSDALSETLTNCKHRLFISTADVKELHVPSRTGRRARSILSVFDSLSKKHVEIRLLHSGIPSGPFLERIKEHGLPAGLRMRRCPRVHAKALIADGKLMYLGSANLTGAGLGAKSAHRRNFEAGIWTDDLALIDPVADMLETIWNGKQCPACGRKKYCPVPLEEPDLQK
jgi:hypothetical protein